MTFFATHIPLIFSLIFVSLLVLGLIAAVVWLKRRSQQMIHISESKTKLDTNTLSNLITSGNTKQVKRWVKSQLPINYGQEIDKALQACRKSNIIAISKEFLPIYRTIYPFRYVSSDPTKAITLMLSPEQRKKPDLVELWEDTLCEKSKQTQDINVRIAAQFPTSSYLHHIHLTPESFAVYCIYLAGLEQNNPEGKKANELILLSQSIPKREKKPKAYLQECSAEALNKGFTFAPNQHNWYPLDLAIALGLADTAEEFITKGVKRTKHTQKALEYCKKYSPYKYHKIRQAAELAPKDSKAHSHSNVPSSAFSKNITTPEQQYSRHAFPRTPPSNPKQNPPWAENRHYLFIQ